jgi:hypothetical protein
VRLIVVINPPFGVKQHLIPLLRAQVLLAQVTEAAANGRSRLTLSSSIGRVASIGQVGSLAAEEDACDCLAVELLGGTRPAASILSAPSSN